MEQGADSGTNYPQKNFLKSIGISFSYPFLTYIQNKCTINGFLIMWIEKAPL